MKRCSKCGEEKPLDAFSWARKAKGERHSRCKRCRSVAGMAPTEIARQRASRRTRYHRSAQNEDFREKAADRTAAWRRDHPGHYLTDASRRTARAVRRRARGIVDTAWCEVLEQDVCAYCGGPAGEVDHIEPDASQGTFENLTPACRSCNAQKERKPLLRFMLERSVA